MYRFMMWQDLDSKPKGNWFLFGALATGCVIGASSIVIYQRLVKQLEEASKTNSLVSELTSLNSTILELNLALKELRENQASSRPLKSALRSVSFSDAEELNNSKDDDRSSQFYSGLSSTASTDYFSAISSDDDEFYDLPVERDITVFDNNIPDIRAGDQEDRSKPFFRYVDELMEGSKENKEEAFRLLKSNESIYSHTCDYAWRLSRCLYLLSVCHDSTDNRKELLFEAVEWGRKAMDINNNSADAHKWFAIAVGSRSEYLSIKEKILDGFEFKKHIDRAAELAPDDHSIHYLLGRFCYEVSELSWWERKMAATLFADPPFATIDEAMEHFMRAEKLKTEGWRENRLYVAKCYIKQDKIDEAKQWLERANELPIKNTEDQKVQEEIDQLLEKM